MPQPHLGELARHGPQRRAQRRPAPRCSTRRRRRHGRGARSADSACATRCRASAARPRRRRGQQLDVVAVAAHQVGAARSAPIAGPVRAAIGRARARASTPNTAIGARPCGATRCGTGDRHDRLAVAAPPHASPITAASRAAQRCTGSSRPRLRRRAIDAHDRAVRRHDLAMPKLELAGGAVERRVEAPAASRWPARRGAAACSQPRRCGSSRDVARFASVHLEHGRGPARGAPRCCGEQRPVLASRGACRRSDR